MLDFFRTWPEPGGALRAGVGRARPLMRLLDLTNYVRSSLSYYSKVSQNILTILCDFHHPLVADAFDQPPLRCLMLHDLLLALFDCLTGVFYFSSDCIRSRLRK